MNKTPIPGVSIELVNNDLFNWNLTFDGPVNTPHEGGKYVVNFESDNYPFKYPKIKFITKIYHPSVSRQDGTICEKHLQDTWAPTVKIDTVIKVVISALANIDEDSPVDAEVAGVYKSNRK